MKNFDNIPRDDGAILFRTENKFGELDCVFETWIWDGIQANSIIFHKNNVSHLSDEELEKMIKESLIFKKDNSVTISRKNEKYTFVNFNFE